LAASGSKSPAAAQGFGMELIGYDPFIAPVIARENQVTLVPIDEIFKKIGLPDAPRRPDNADRGDDQCHIAQRS
jgi:hypothetical protein